jgi:hypothetical protein
MKGVGQICDYAGLPDNQTDAWLVAQPLGSRVKASSPAWQQISPLYQALDEHNNGRLCAPHRD